ncbi:IS66 family insertion sequence element accessory protein TnpB [Blautia hydrogenotrophica]|uniref:IS66 family insertion sequence element accessory protein TnpB n=1 Tax=Blautia hydrogenotrophica TaxID=53443 RepID=UPI003AB93B05
MAIIRNTYETNLYSNSLFLFYGRHCDQVKTLHFEKDRLAESNLVCSEKRLLTLCKENFLFPHEARNSRRIHYEHVSISSILFIHHILDSFFYLCNIHTRK